MNIDKLVIGKRYITTCGDLGAVTVREIIRDNVLDCYLVSFEYRGRLYFCGADQLVCEVNK